MTIEEQAIIYFKDMRKRMCEDHLKICPKDSVAYRATLIEKGFYDTAIKALEQEASYNSVNSLVESKLKNPKAKTFDILHFVADNAGLSTFEAIEKAYNMGVSEQKAVLDKVRAEIREWYWQADKQELAKDPCVVDAMTDLFIRTIAKYQAESEDKE